MKPIRITPRLAFWVLAAVTLLVSHDLIFLVQFGPGESLATTLRSAQHGYWTWVSLAILVGAAAAALVTVRRAVGLQRRARQMEVPVAGIRGGPLLARAAVAWVRLLAVVGIGFAIQENVEHWLSHGHLIGLGAVTGPEYPLAVPVLAAATAVAALVGAAIRTVERELVAAIEAALHRSEIRPPRRIRQPARSGPLRRRPAMAGSAAGRAPPLFVGI